MPSCNSCNSSLGSLEDALPSTDILQSCKPLLRHLLFFIFCHLIFFYYDLDFASFMLYFSLFFSVVIDSFNFPFVVPLLLHFPCKFLLCLAIFLLCDHLLNHASFHLLVHILLHAPLCLPFFHIEGYHTSCFLFIVHLYFPHI